jgi:hypothetical protein
VHVDIEPTAISLLWPISSLDSLSSTYPHETARNQLE